MTGLWNSGDEAQKAGEPDYKEIQHSYAQGLCLYSQLLRSQKLEGSQFKSA
jgi:hypothetical protein